MSPETQAGARAFVRSLNILLKFARLYEFGHAKTTAQFDTTWKELRQALGDSADLLRDRQHSLFNCRVATAICPLRSRLSERKCEAVCAG